MAHDQIHDAADQTAKLQRQAAGPQAGQMPGLPGPAIAQLAATPGIVANPLLNGRGNGPVRAAVLQRLQQTHGNRAVQRMMAQGRSRLPAVQRTEGGEQAAGPQASGGGGGALTVGNGLTKDTPLIPPGPLPVAEGAGPASGATAGATPDANAPVQMMPVGLTPMQLRLRLPLDGIAAVQRKVVYPAGALRVIQRYAVPADLACSGLASWLRSSSPYAPDWAETHPQYAFNGAAMLKTSGSDGKFTATITGNSKLTVSIANASNMTDMPSWSPTERPNQAAEVAAWNAMIAKLTTHEGKHRAIAETWRATMEKNWQGLNVSGTGATEEEAKDAARAARQAAQDQWGADAQAAQSAIDPPQDSEGIVLTCP